MALRARKVSGAFEKRAPGLKPGPLDTEHTNHETAPSTCTEITLCFWLLTKTSQSQNTNTHHWFLMIYLNASLENFTFSDFCSTQHLGGRLLLQINALN